MNARLQAPGSLPTIALFIGDPAGIGPELSQKLLQNPECLAQARIILITHEGAVQAPPGVETVDWPGRRAGPFAPGQAGADNGRYMLQGLTTGLELVTSGAADAICFAPSTSPRCAWAACTRRTSCAGSPSSSITRACVASSMS